MAGFTEFTNLADARLGATAIAANDEFFAEKANLLKPEPPVWIPDRYTDRGKWMDGWETRRRRTPGHDWCLIRLGISGIVRGIAVDTSFFTGNFPSHCSVDACAAPADASAADLQSERTRWVELLPKSELRGDCVHAFEVTAGRRFTHVRLNIFPDGGVARLRVYGEPLTDWPALIAAAAGAPGQVPLVNVSAIEHGGRAIDCSDRFYSHPQNLLMPYRAANMGDGWETKRRRGPGHDWAIVRLGIEAIVRCVEVDTTHFKGNYPDSCSLDVARVAGDLAPSSSWDEVLPQSKLGPDAPHLFHLRRAAPATHVRLNIYPDGGISRLRVLGTPTREGRLREGLRALNAMDEDAVAGALAACCGSDAWVERMAAARPYVDLDDCLTKADTTWRSLGRAAWLQAFARHPRIGDRPVEAARSPASHRWSAEEQSQAQEASPETLRALAEGNRAYEDRFGYVFLVRAAGRTAEEMLSRLRDRLRNDPDTELPIAASEQEAITRLRLEKLLLGG
jgi:allantoicase